MLYHQAKEIKTQFCHYNPIVENDFNDEDGYYMRVYSNKDHSQYLIKGMPYNPTIVAVGLGEYRIGFKTLNIDLAGLRKLLKKNG